MLLDPGQPAARHTGAEGVVRVESGLHPRQSLTHLLVPRTLVVRLRHVKVVHRELLLRPRQDRVQDCPGGSGHPLRGGFIGHPAHHTEQVARRPPADGVVVARVPG
jgi:hypothetical protein